MSLPVATEQKLQRGLIFAKHGRLSKQEMDAAIKEITRICRESIEMMRIIVPPRSSK